MAARSPNVTTMRALVAFLLFAALAFTSARAADIEFVRVWPGWRSAGSFERISEFFNGKENTGREFVHRTQPDIREGFYFLVRVKNRGPVLAGAKFSLQVITPTSADTKLFTFPVEVGPKEPVFQLGLTGSDWTDPEAHPVAWKLELVDPNGSTLASQQSFLWEKPSK